MKQKESYRWVICGASTLLLFCVVGISCSAFAFHLPYIRSVNGFSNTQTSMLLTIQSLCSISTNLLIDRYYRKVSLRSGITFAMLLFFCAYATYAHASTYMMFCLGAMLSGFSTGLTGTTAAALLINTWFKDNRGFALGIATAGTGLASVVGPPILTPIIENHSLSAAFRAETVFALVCTVLLFIVIKKGPYSMSGAGAAPSQASSPAAEKSSLFVFTGRRFFIFMVGIFFCGFLVHGVTAALSLILQESFSGGQRATLISIFGFSVMAGKIVCGRLADRIGMYRTNFLFYSFLGLGLALVCLAKDFPMGIAAVVFLGLGSPFATVSVPVFVSDLARKERYPTALKYSNLTMTVARMIFTTIAGASADLFGSYVPLFATMCALTPFTAFLIQNTYVKCDPAQKRR